MGNHDRVYNVTVGDNGGYSDVDGGEKVQNIILHASKLALPRLTYGLNNPVDLLGLFLKQ